MTSMKVPNQPAPPNAGNASQLTVGHHWPGVGEPGRSPVKRSPNARRISSHGNRGVLAFFWLCVVAPQCDAQSALTITFDGQRTNSSVSVTNYVERGTRFAGYFSRTGPDSPNRPNNGTAYIQPTGIIMPTWAPAICSRLDGLPFRLVAVDLAAYSLASPDGTATFEGHRSDGTIVTTNFVVNGLDFRTFLFSAEFSELTNALIAAGALDNLQLQLPTIPPVMRIQAYPEYSSVEWLNVRAEGTLGLRYRLECKDSLLGTNWIGCTEAESMLWFTINKSQRTNAAQRFFRAVELSSP